MSLNDVFTVDSYKNVQGRRIWFVSERGHAVTELRRKRQAYELRDEYQATYNRRNR